MQADVDVAEYIWYVVRIRVAPVAVICALGCTRLRKLVVALFLLDVYKRQDDGCITYDCRGSEARRNRWIH